MNIINLNLKFKGLAYGNAHKVIVLHHAAATTCSAADVHKWHQNKGWSGIGYHFFVRKDGSVYLGRPINAIGAHTLGYNAVGIGICAEGNFMNEKMPVKQKQAIIELCKSLVKTYGIKLIKGHKELDSTDCPGTNYPLDKIKKDTFAIAEVVYPMIRLGAKGEIVKVLQRILKINADGIFGPNTLKAVKAFQYVNGLVSDGIVGPATWKKLK